MQQLILRRCYSRNLCYTSGARIWSHFRYLHVPRFQQFWHKWWGVLFWWFCIWFLAFPSKKGELININLQANGAQGVLNDCGGNRGSCEGGRADEPEFFIEYGFFLILIVAKESFLTKSVAKFPTQTRYEAEFPIEVGEINMNLSTEVYSFEMLNMKDMIGRWKVSW